MRSTRTLHTPLIQTEHLTAKTPAVGQDRPYRIVRLTEKHGAVECDHEERPGQSSGTTHSGRLRVELFVKNHETESCVDGHRRQRRDGIRFIVPCVSLDLQCPPTMISMNNHKTSSEMDKMLYLCLLQDMGKGYVADAWSCSSSTLSPQHQRLDLFLQPPNR
jgi:hypothetical protein